MLELGRIDDKSNTLNGEYTTLEKRIVTIGDIKEQRDKLNKIKTVLVTMDGLEEELTVKQESLNKLKDELSTLTSSYASFVTQKKQITKEFEKWSNYDYTSENVCPTCFQNVDVEHIRDHINIQVGLYTDELEDVNEMVRKFEGFIVSVNFKIGTQQNEIIVVNGKLDKKRKLEGHLITLSGVEEKELEIIDTTKRIVEIVHELLPVLSENRDKINLKLDVITTDKGIADGIILEKQSLQSEYNELIQQKTLLEQSVDTEERIYNNQKEIYDRVMTEHESNIISKVQLESEVSEFDGEIQKLETMKDYIEYIKTTLKDENVKQYAIGNIIPYLQQQTNHYLAETGHSYYVELDAWLDGVIQGYGVGDCEFGNMSGGEGKSIDLALKFAMMDVARRQAGSYLDVLVLDELLDSSIDSFGIEKTFDIIKMKQREDNLKVFIVSHREEVADFGNDSVYKVTKEDGFSTIEVL